jgi:hypothetical protein
MRTTTMTPSRTLITKKQKQEDEEDLKSAFTFELPPYSAPLPPYSPTVSPLPSVVSEPHFLHRQWRKFQSMRPCLNQLMFHPNLPPRFIIPNQRRRAAPQRLVSASEIRILLTLYWTVMVGLEKRYRAAEDLTTTTEGRLTRGKSMGKKTKRRGFRLSKC